MLTISTINYRNWQATKLCISDLVTACKGIECRILVRDNSEVGETAELRRSLSDSPIPILYFESPDNPGFGEGHNRNFRAVSHGLEDVFLVVNNDIRIPDTRVIETMLAVCSPRRIVSCIIRTAKHGDVWCAGGDINRLTGDIVGTRESFDGEVRFATFVPGCCMMVRSDLYQSLGGFDRDFFMYSEDLDFCMRARTMGAEVVVVNLPIIHEVGSGEKGLYSDLYLYEGTKNRLICQQRHRLGVAPIRYVYFVLKYGLLRSLQLAVYSPAPRKQIHAAWRGIFDGYFETKRSRPRLPNDGSQSQAHYEQIK